MSVIHFRQQKAVFLGFYRRGVCKVYSNYKELLQKLQYKMSLMNEVKVTKVIVHPLVLLSVVDHFNRMGKIGNQKRVVGVLLGCWRQKGVLDVSNSFAGIYIIQYNL